MSKKTKEKAEFGDFQTPEGLARSACRVVSRLIAPASIIEPTCGKGNFLCEALDAFPSARKAIGAEINPAYVHHTQDKLRRRGQDGRSEVICGDFFATDWPRLIRDLPGPLLVIGNPPWITNAALGSLGSDNLPRKCNFQNHRGFDAKTGKSNFDISEWMLVKLLEWLNERNATLAMLCKTAVARKVLLHAWKNRLTVQRAELHKINAVESFDAAVDACLLVCTLSPSAGRNECHIYQHLGDQTPSTLFGYRDDLLLADLSAYERLRPLRGQCTFSWRSGVKHDCSRVMELRRDGQLYRNGLGEVVELEDGYLYPMLKSSELAGGAAKTPQRRMLVPQRSIGEDPEVIRDTAPKTWEYLQAHAELLDRRASSIYKDRPRFSVFGIGPYTFAPWKVAISGFYKALDFVTVVPYDGKPVILDDTSYFIACETQPEADCICALLNSELAREFYSALIFWDAKRPITVGLLSQLNLAAVAEKCDLGPETSEFMRRRKMSGRSNQDGRRQLLFDGFAEGSG